MVSLALVSPLIFLAWAERRTTRGEAVFVTCGQFLALFPGLPGSYLRSAFYATSLQYCSWDVRIGFGTYFSHRSARLGKHVSIGSFCVIGTATIDDEAMLASRISIASGKHQHFDDSMRLSSEPRFERVTIGRECWIGEAAVILADVGQRCIVSAGTVVVDTIPNGYIVAGNPGKKLKPVHELRETSLCAG